MQTIVARTRRMNHLFKSAQKDFFYKNLKRRNPLKPLLSSKKPRQSSHGLSGLPNANAKSQRFSYAISQVATPPLVVALNRSSKSQLDTLRSGTQSPNRIGLIPLVPPNRSVLNRNAFKAQNATKSQMLAF